MGNEDERLFTPRRAASFRGWRGGCHGCKERPIIPPRAVRVCAGSGDVVALGTSFSENLRWCVVVIFGFWNARCLAESESQGKQFFTENYFARHFIVRRLRIQQRFHLRVVLHLRFCPAASCRKPPMPHQFRLLRTHKRQLHRGAGRHGHSSTL